ncbi:hypothetical protein Q3G72_021497 [Acer saccharum]|nr:hypothetical protein Q3G72_021497 [Acer saccharum]
MASDYHKIHAALFTHSMMTSQPSLNTSGELLHPPTVGNYVGHEDRLLLNNALRGRSKSRIYRPISKTTSTVPLKNVFDTLNDISKPSLHNDAYEVSNDDKPVEEVQVDSLAIGKVYSGSEKTNLKASNILSSSEIVAFSPSELEVVEVGSSNSNLVKTMGATKASNMISFNMNDDASTRQHTGPIILHNSTLF